jgi:hypothetical protein
MIAEAAAALRTAQNADGGWAMYAGRSSNTEATALVTLALARLDDGGARAGAERGVRWLVSCQNTDGGWPLNRHLPASSWTTALAVLALGSLEREATSAARGARWLLRRRPRTPGPLVTLIHRFAPDALGVKFDPTLEGWSWTAGTASFVEPTAYAVLALKKVGRRLPGTHVAERIREAERMIRDRMCREGGWNYGNSRVLGADLWPYADVTALTLLALADHRAHPDSQRSLLALRRLLEHVDSGLALAWGALCFAAYGEDAGPWRTRLHRAWRRTRFVGDARSTALAILAMSDGARAVTP